MEVVNMASKTRIQKILDLAGQFVIEQKGAWGHAEWEELVGKAAALGVEASDENKRSLGNIIEACKELYSEAEDVAPAKKPAAKSRAKTKS